MCYLSDDVTNGLSKSGSDSMRSIKIIQWISVAWYLLPHYVGIYRVKVRHGTLSKRMDEWDGPGPTDTRKNQSKFGP